MSQDVAVDHVTGNIQIIIRTNEHTPKRRRKQKWYWQDGPYNFARDEESLWKAVITQAVVDACNRSPLPDFMYYKKLAVGWLTGGCADFIDVCVRAGLDPDRVHVQAKKALMHPSLWRAEAGHGDRFEELRAWRAHRKQARAAESRAQAPAATCIVIHPFN